jgi:PAS domain S-box-containing protein
MEIEAIAMREAEYNVGKSEALFRALVQNSADIFFLVTSDFHLTYISDAITKVLGYYPDELADTPLLELIHSDDQHEIKALLHKLSTHQLLLPVEVRMKTSIGNWNYVEISGNNLLLDDEVNAIVITCRDIKAKKIADQALMQTEHRLSLLLNNTKESFIILDNRLQVVSYNKAAQEHSPFFFRQELQSGLSFFELIDPLVVDEYRVLLSKVISGVEQEKDTEFQDGSGELHIYCHVFRALDLGLDGSGIFITSSNITEQRKAEKALKESEEKFKAIIEYSFDAVVIIDENAVVQYASPSVTNLIGFAPEDLIGRSGFDFIYHEDIPHVEQKLASIINYQDETYADYRSLTKEGTLKWLEAKGKNMFQNPHIGGVLVSFRDITQRKQMLEEQYALTNELTKYNKDLQQFSFITSHNLRAPVANLMSLLALYNRQKMEDPFNAELLVKFDECTHQLNETLNDLINVLVVRANPNADTEYIKFADVAELTRRNVQALLKAADAEFFTNFSLAEGVEYNKIHLESIFINLVSNAIKYASPERRLAIRIHSEKTEEGVRLTFSDNGIGIDLNRYGDRIFGLYQRFHSGKQGKGLGLYMIKSQILASGGSIKVASEPGKGTSFFVHLKRSGIAS